jgi:hypothetical protein
MRGAPISKRVKFLPPSPCPAARAATPASPFAPIVMIRRGALKFTHSPAEPDRPYDIERDSGF